MAYSCKKFLIDKKKLKKKTLFMDFLTYYWVIY